MTPASLLKVGIAAFMINLSALYAFAGSGPCPETASGKKWGKSFDSFAEASVNGKPYSRCEWKPAPTNKVLGRGYYFNYLICPNFKVVSRGEGGTSAIKQAFDRYSLYPKFFKQWHVIDKNGVKYKIFDETYGEGIKPVIKHEHKVFQNSYKTKITYLLKGEGIDITFRRHWTNVQENKSIPSS